MGCNESCIPLISLPGREITSDTLLLAEMAHLHPSKVCFDLGCGTGEVFTNANFQNTFTVGIDVSSDALALFDKSAGQPVQCSVEMVSRLFRKGCADLVLANPPYDVTDSSRPSPDSLRNEARQGDSLLLFRFIFAGAHLLGPGGFMIITGRYENSEEIEFGLRAAGFKVVERFRRNRVIALKALLQNS